MISVVQAQELIRRHTPTLALEYVALPEAGDRVLREAVASPEDLPGFDRSAMDGYAVRADDDADEFAVVGEIRAGASVDRTLEPGQTVRIFTGARLPSPGLKVIMQEHVEAGDGRIRIAQRSDATHIRLRGEDSRAGEVLLKAGTTLDAAAVALLASIGCTNVPVSARPRVLHLTTGDEIVPAEATPGPGQIRNSNAYLVAQLCREHGVATVTHRHADDDLLALVAALTQAQAETYDVILISGGSGGGAYDFSAELFRHLGATIHFREINVRPGKPLIFGSVARGSVPQIVFGLPGNALSHFVCFQLFVRTALDRMLFRASAAPISGVLAAPMREITNARETWWPARVRFTGGRLECEALPWKSSGDITRLPGSNALIHVPPSTSHFDAGTMVSLLLTAAVSF